MSDRSITRKLRSKVSRLSVGLGTCLHESSVQGGGVSREKAEEDGGDLSVELDSDVVPLPPSLLPSYYSFCRDKLLQVPLSLFFEWRLRKVVVLLRIVLPIVHDRSETGNLHLCCCVAERAFLLLMFSAIFPSADIKARQDLQFVLLLLPSAIVLPTVFAFAPAPVGSLTLAALRCAPGLRNRRLQFAISERLVLCKGCAKAVF